MASEVQKSKSEADESLKLALAMALFRSKLLQKPLPPPPPPPSVTSHSDALKWKRKAKERKQEILRLKEDLKQADDDFQYDLFPQTASCKCYFFDNAGSLCSNTSGDGSDRRFSDVLRRRFLRQVRLKEKRTDGSAQKRCLSDCNSENEFEQLRTSVDFLVELCDNVSSIRGRNFANWSHQAVGFILDAIKDLLSMELNIEPVEGIVNSLIVRLVRRMCATLQGDGKSLGVDHFDTDAQFCVQHLIRKLGSEPYVGQRVILSVSQRISVLAEGLLFMDPFDDAYPSIHRCMYIMIQLVEFLVSDYLVTWSSIHSFDTGLFEEWLTLLLHARKTVEILESRTGLYFLYMDRVIGEVAKIVGQLSSLQALKSKILDNLFH